MVEEAVELKVVPWWVPAYSNRSNRRGLKDKVIQVRWLIKGRTLTMGNTMSSYYEQYYELLLWADYKMGINSNTIIVINNRISYKTSYAVG